ncbi:MAG TPA: TolC family outer membrane protein [Rhodocyclaceae bacterium]
MSRGLPRRRGGWPKIAALSLAFVAIPAAAADLLEVYRLAQANDATYEVARYGLEAAREKIPQARAGLLPNLAVNGSDNRNRAKTAFGDYPQMDRDVRAWTWTLQLTQPLVRMQNIYAYSASQSLVEQAEAEFAQAEQALILGVAQAYFDVLVAEEALLAARVQEKAMTAQWTQARRGFETGVTAITDVHEAKSKADSARFQRVAAENDLEVKHSELERIVGRVPNRLARLAPRKVVPRPEPADPQAWIAQARESSPAVRARKAAFDAAEAEVGRNRSEHLPTLDAVASYGSNYSSGSLTTPADYSTRMRSRQIGVQLTIPIFAGGATSAKVAESIANRSKAQAQLEEARRKAAADARQAYAAIMNGLSQIEAMESAVESGQSSVKGNQAGYRLGIRINSDVLGAEQQLYSSQRDLAKARYDTLLQGLKLKAAAGALSEADVATINALLATRERE